jgi:hypothetical protein
MNLDWMFVFMQYGLPWRRQRRAFHQYVNSHAVGQYHPVMYEERNALLRRLKTHPNDFLKHLHSYVTHSCAGINTESLNVSFLATILMRMAYGLGEKHNVALIQDAERSFTAFATARTPGKYLVNSFPILRHIPAWFPGAGFRRHFQEVAQMNQRLLHEPFDAAKKNSVSPNSVNDLESFVFDCPLEGSWQKRPSKHGLHLHRTFIAP